MSTTTKQAAQKFSKEERAAMRARAKELKAAEDGETAVRAALDDAERGAEAVGAARADVHLLDDRAVAPPFGDQRRIRPDGEDVGARRVEDPLDADLELVRRGYGGRVHRAPLG